MHSLKNTVVAVGLLALAFMFYQSSSPQPQGDSGEPQANLEIAGEPFFKQPNPADIEPEQFGPVDISPPKRLPKQPVSEKPVPEKPAFVQPSPLQPSPLQPTKPESLIFEPAAPLTEDAKQKNLAFAIRNEAKSLEAPKIPLTSPSPRDGSLASEVPQVPDNSFDAQAGGIENPNLKTPRKLGSKEVADIWIQVDLDLKQNDFKSALRTLSNYHASNDLNGPQRQKTMEWINQLAAKVIWSQEAHLESPDPSTIEIPLAQLAQQWGVSVPLIQKINGLPESQTSAIPSTLKVVKGPFDLKVNRDDNKMTLYLGELYGCQFDFAGINLSPGEYLVNMNSGNILLKTTDGRRLVIRGEFTTSSVAPQCGIISLSDSQLKEVCELLTLDSTVTIR